MEQGMPFAEKCKKKVGDGATAQNLKCCRNFERVTAQNSAQNDVAMDRGLGTGAYAWPFVIGMY
jgi:hypothetical protein